ncbi:hypothetical protein [Paraburkholderia tropica]|uniref:hypothetical protein n=1 Tax=Paraburkholderia tropica TaxID=92647 RepID=UPI003D2B4371
MLEDQVSNINELSLSEGFTHFAKAETLTGRAFQRVVKLPLLDTDEFADRALRPYSTIIKWRELTTPIRMGGRKVARYLAPTILEWLDPVTGELIPDEQARSDRRYRFPFRAGEKQLQREMVLSGLRTEPRKFAQFVIQFRNRRRGITPGIQQLAKWYGQQHDKRLDNVKRYIKPLMEVEILESDSLVGPLWKQDGNSRDDTAENANAVLTYFNQMTLEEMATRKGVLESIANGTHPRPDWMLTLDRRHTWEQ